MARTKLTVQKIEKINVATTAALVTDMATAIDHTDGGEFVMDDRDDKYLIILENANASGAKDVTIKKGNAPAGVTDLKVNIAANSYVLLRIDSARYKNVTGDDKGKVIIKTSSSADDTKVAVICLP